ncbi:Asp23/Gls24 family envelope stress response protein [Nocardia sp. CDC159]|uniref:Asp23/Gls24 family envelope stress response protein n=1 Tax=Nocardia pulmonis TaxID=2951408 RepID=A0A9X2IXT3_9NOCA|nr:MULTISPECIES: Asp23/Gls24 family envelope stress response protein [Nocardia]MCM6776347.1 Asp23/Gls24 family envelope stress response protein [Nocardia pulmonis]MCM6788771.1 Asp23/Gls24 family envelope stress response protein [Nocardia sp. CDC159]
MTSTVTDIASATAESAFEPPRLRTVDDVTVAALAVAAAREITGVMADAMAFARIRGNSVDLTVQLPIRYPMPVWQVAAVCRRHITERVRQRAGLAVRKMDIEVTALTVTPAARGRR